MTDADEAMQIAQMLEDLGEQVTSNPLVYVLALEITKRAALERASVNLSPKEAQRFAALFQAFCDELDRFDAGKAVLWVKPS